ncbi:two-component response regulator-like APRR9 [Lotus japonicus]|uniref:two-component response regulator-like APRR9 n=1 Tax=Lotus japonicus TaxID=34305 RepID=UPI0025895368|nr:two-component response regulator-like APRR9 [Lotus japonicus]
MSSDLYAFGTTFHTHSSSDLVSADGDVGDFPFFPDPFTCFTSSPTDEAQKSSISNPFDETLANSLDPFSPSFSSFSPPSSHLGSLSLYAANRVQQQQPLSSNGSNLATEYGCFSAFDESEVKSEESQMGVVHDYTCSTQKFIPHSYSGAEDLSKYMQRSFSSNCFEGKPSFLFQNSHHDASVDSSKFQKHEMNSPEHSVFSGQMRRVCSTGDLQNMKGNHMSPSEGPVLEESNFKVGRYSAEERKERISKYRAKRNQRNFNKTIKYACRKTLADNRPRIRGRFARNDETC